MPSLRFIPSHLSLFVRAAFLREALLCAALTGTVLLALPHASALAQPTTSAPVVAAPVSKEAFVQGMAKRALAVLGDPKLDFRQQQSIMRGLFTEVVDIDWIAKFVLGPVWKTATPEQKSRYLTLYRTYITEGYVSKFDADSVGKVRDIKIVGMQDAPGGTFSASTEVVQTTASEPNVKVDYRLHQTQAGYKIIDITVEGVSLLTTHRQEFAAIANNGGMEAVITKLQETMQKAVANQ